MRKAGATPKLTMSTRLSSSAPNRVPVLERRATRPSSASRMPAKKMYHPARSNSPRDASTIDHTPKNRLKSVNRLGTTITTRRMQELPAVVADQLDGARRGIAVHVHVEHVHEDGDPGRRGREIQRLVHHGDVHDLPVRRCDHELFPARPGPDRIAKEHQKPHR